MKSVQVRRFGHFIVQEIHDFIRLEQKGDKIVYNLQDLISKSNIHLENEGLTASVIFRKQRAQTDVLLR